MEPTMVSETPSPGVAVGPQADSSATAFVDRRNAGEAGRPGRERRQFTNSHTGLSPEAAELAEAIDAYKLRNRRRFINYEEMLSVIKKLGYSK